MDFLSNRRFWLILLSGLAILSLSRDVAFLFESPYPYGIDGYYYLALLDSPDGAGAIDRSAPQLPVAFLHLLRALAPGAAAVKLAGLLALYATAVAACALIFVALRSVPLSGLAFFLVAKGFMRAELLVNFVKQSIGQALLVGMLLCLAAWFRNGKRGWLVAGAVLFCALPFTHRLAFALGLLMLLCLGVFWVLVRPGRIGPFPLLMVWIFGLWGGILGALLLPHWFGEWQRLLQESASVWPRWTASLGYDRLAPVTVVVPAVFIQTVGLLAAFAYLLVGAWRMRRGGAGTQPDAIMPANLCVPWAALVVVAITLAPFWRNAGDVRQGLHFRLICTLGPMAAILIPTALAASGLRERWSNILILLLVVAFALPPADWPTSAYPPPDGGALHRAMVEKADQIPKDATIITSLRVGNMVSALWRRPRVIDGTGASAAHGDDAYYRFLLLPPEAEAVLDTLVRDSVLSATSLHVHGPWYLMPEADYQTFRNHLQTHHSDIL